MFRTLDLRISVEQIILFKVVEQAIVGGAGLLFTIIFGFTLFYQISDLISRLGAIVILGMGLYIWSQGRLTQAQKTYG